MQLEDRVFSDKRVQDLSRMFVCVKVDPRESQDAREHKATRFVPEVVFLTKDGKAITRLEDRSVPGVVSLMNRVLAKYGR